MRGAWVLGLVGLLGIGSVAATGPSPLAAIQAELAQSSPLGDALAAAEPTQQVELRLPAGAAWEAQLDAGGALTLRPVSALAPLPGDDPNAAGCTVYGGAAAVWIPSPPAIDPQCGGQPRHHFGIQDAKLYCLGAPPIYGCAFIGEDYATHEYFGVLCGLPIVPVGGVYDTGRDLSVFCSSFGPPLSSVTDWSVTLSENTVGVAKVQLAP